MAGVEVVVNHELCNLCGLCIDLCPTRVFNIRNGSLVIDSSRCIYCFGCVALCPRRAITLKLSKNWIEIIPCTVKVRSLEEFMKKD